MKAAAPSGRETSVFVASTLFISYTLAAIFLLTGERHGVLIRALMCVPGVMAVAIAWSFRREPPRAAGFEFRGWRPWAAALLFPLAFEVVAVLLAYAVRLATGRRDFIHFQPENLSIQFVGLNLTGLSALAGVAGLLISAVLLWLAIAFAYRRRWPDRFKQSLPARLRWLHHGFRAFIWLPVFFIPNGLGGKLFSLPGELGEEIGWRGYLVRRWAARPVASAAITAFAWSMFHLPVPFFEGQRGHYFQNVAFLGSLAAFAVTFQAFYLWSRSVWPCAVLHLSWNMCNEAILGDVYGWQPGLFGGQFWVFNGEGFFGLLINGVVALWLIRRWARGPRTQGDEARGAAA